MKKERKPLTTREKVLIGVGVVGVCVSGYLGYKYVKDLKIIKDQKNTMDDLIKDLMSRDTEAEIAKKIALEAMDAANNQEVINDITKEALEETTKELNFLKFLVVEGNIVPHAKQNATNKLSRHYTKLERLLKHVEEFNEDMDTIKAIALEREEIAIMVKNLELTEALEVALNNDECIYAKNTHAIMRRYK